MSDISARRFTLFLPDAHHVDGEGIGCESRQGDEAGAVSDSAPSSVVRGKRVAVATLGSDEE
jgi:hypothetical protein